MTRLLCIGLDCAPPALVFDRLKDAMPNVAGLMARGSWGPLRSTEPPITVPAWTSMVSGRDPGELGLYGFRNRERGSYALRLATSRDVKVKRVWDYLGEAGKTVASLYVPLTWPPTPVRGQMVSCFLTPDDASPWAFPRSLEAELRARFGPHRPDVRDFRADDLDRIFGELVETTRTHFAVAKHVWDEKRPDFLMMVEMGTDRFHHAFWHHVDPSHPRYDPDGPHRDAARRYYGFVDAQLGALLEGVGDDTAVLVVSDHGARAMRGGVCINEWLMEQGWLALRSRPRGVTPLDAAGVDYARTRAWGEGGYYARVFLNVEGRDPEGVIPAARYEEERTRLADALASMRGPDGAPLGNRVTRPEDVYARVRGEPPDLLVYFGDLDYRSLGTVGHGRVFVESNDTGPDSCNHDWDGVFVLAGGGEPARGRVAGAEIYDVARTILRIGGVAPPGELRGRDLAERPRAADVR